ncbi:hypothetical protein FMEAI12_4800017 [Parafrankia sp. Ea1.12]|nr:hypothetical protein FMEAI12_4800017 [Parafrankia sp. Ea1.12]
MTVGRSMVPSGLRISSLVGTEPARPESFVAGATTKVPAGRTFGPAPRLARANPSLPPTPVPRQPGPAWGSHGIGFVQEGQDLAGTTGRSGGTPTWSRSPLTASPPAEPGSPTIRRNAHPGRGRDTAPTSRRTRRRR